MPLDPLQPPFVPASQAYITQERTSLQGTNPEKKINKQTSRVVVIESKQDVDELVKLALDLTWDTCFDGTQVIFKEPETLTIFRVEPIRLKVKEQISMLHNDEDGGSY